ncbi:helix-turn-helix domain-containing protein [Ohtaekwangia koreensis]|uniref:Cro/C1-type HTH DNA-binding domain-containing protein n=1 Tax=Ohtaekwangia koreensis TaxID=688867 RepID=A0A1T5L6F7_9BACT|nr:helix-turn-helix domain-containing protein [Ohtaekwangia koreensis]SKC71656.1 Cro/C1-type HTH DNA-binding domain-containing protein [Ohtaekwangia koreensis]
MNIHVGQEIEKVLLDSGIKKKEFARRIHTSTRNVYSILKKKEIKTDQLIVISKVLNYNFFSLYVKPIEEQRLHMLSVMNEMQQCNARKNNNKVMITLELDGKPETLAQSIKRLQMINQALD